ncbi:hypothetical protein ABIE52_006743 [Rhodococcus sp. OAS809]|uniref:hypothetical protein n=1 Tax=Rhodococcus sp. OAS809 TaxID=2663874 RepID=UPI0017894F40
MATTPSASQLESHAPWLDVNHWASGEDAVWVSFNGVDELEALVKIASPADQSIFEGRNTDTPTTWIDGYAHVRHVHSCAPCLAWLNGARLYGKVMGGYWSQWSSAARLTRSALGNEILWHREGNHAAGTFTEDADIPDWLREVTAGHLLLPESPSLSVARIWDPIDWPTLLEQHPGELPVLVDGGWTQPQITWDLIVDVYRMVEATGLGVCLDVDLEVDVGGPQLLPQAICSDVRNHPEIEESISAALGIKQYGTEGFWLLH